MAEAGTDRHRTPNHRLRSLRETRCESRDEFAHSVNRKASEMGENVACDERLVARWEDGEIRCPRPVYRRILSALLRVPPHELGFGTSRAAPAAADDFVFTLRPSATGEGSDDPVKRRDFLAGTTTAAIAIGFEEPTRSWMTGDGWPGGRPGRIEAAHVRQLEEITQQIRALDNRFGGDYLCSLAVTHLRGVHRLLGHASYQDDVGRALQSAAGELCVLAGWLSFDAERHADARAYYNEALSAAQVAGDAGLAVHAFANLSLQAAHLGRPREALQFARAATERAATTDPRAGARLTALLSLREARGWALLHDPAACEKALRRASAAHERDDSGDGPVPGSAGDPAWVGFLDRRELASTEGACRADLGQYDRAEALLRQSFEAQHEEFPRNRASYTLRLATLLVQRGDVTGACAVAGETAPLVSTMSSTRIRSQLHEFRRRLAPHAHRRAARQFLAEQAS